MLLNRMITALLVFAFVGGSQVCAAMCKASEGISVAAPVKPVKKSCRQCPAAAATETEKSKPPSPAPCKHCEQVSADRFIAERAQSLATPPVELAIAPVEMRAGGGLTVAGARESMGGLEGVPIEGRLHVFCVLLI